MSKEVYWVKHEYMTKDNRLVLSTVKIVNGEATKERITQVTTPLKPKQR